MRPHWAVAGQLALDEMTNKLLPTRPFLPRLVAKLLNYLSKSYPLKRPSRRGGDGPFHSPISTVIPQLQALHLNVGLCAHQTPNLYTTFSGNPSTHNQSGCPTKCVFIEQFTVTELAEGVSLVVVPT